MIMKAFLIITLFFIGVIKDGEGVCWCLTFFNCAVSYSELDIIKIVAFYSVQSLIKTKSKNP